MLHSSKKTIAALIAAGLMGFAGMAPVSAADMPGIDVSVNQATSFEPGGSRIIRVHIANPDIADIKLIGSHEMIVVGKQAGATTLITWDADGLRQEFIIRVGTHDDNLEYILQHETISLLMNYNIILGCLLLLANQMDFLLFHIQNF